MRYCVNILKDGRWSYWADYDAQVEAERACCDQDCNCWCHERERRREEMRRLEYQRERLIDGQYEISDADPGL